MLTALEVENFKGIGQPVRIDLRPITLLFGPNSAGKSTILHALHYAHEILSRHNLDPDRTQHGGDVVDLGGFRQFVHRRDLDRFVRIRIDLDLRGATLPFLPGAWAMRDSGDGFLGSIGAFLQCGWVEMKVAWDPFREMPLVRSYAVSVNGQLLGQIESNTDGSRIELAELASSHPALSPDGWLEGRADYQVSLSLSGQEDPMEVVARLPSRIGVARMHRSGLPDWDRMLELDSSAAVQDGFCDATILQEFEWRVSMLLVGIGRIARDSLAAMRFLGPMRDVPARSFGSPRFADPSRWATGLGAWDRLSQLGRPFVEEVSSWLSHGDRLNAGYGVRLHQFRELAEESALMNTIRRGAALDEVEDLAEEIGSLPLRSELSLTDANTGLPIQPPDVGVGISQVLPVVVAALDPERPAITAIEQPELHIHPRLQIELGDLFAHQAKDGRVFLLETHSEHLMLRILRRIEETHGGDLPPGKPPLCPNQVSVVFIEQIGGEVKATSLRIDETGEFIDRWPRGFFEERAEELF